MNVHKSGGAMSKLKARGSAIQTTIEREINVPLDKIRFDPTQPRKAFHTLDGRVAEKDELYIAELAASIKEQELIQAITVQESPDGTYLVVVGECRTRAHLLLGLPTIRAIVRNDLTNPSLRLLYQVSENVNRQDLTDEELAISIRALMKGGPEVEPMNQTQIAVKLGKSEAWVSRFVKFGDEELQRVWVKTGIADTVEKVYRISILPKSLQVDILRRVELTPSDPEFLEKPLNRNVIDEFSKLAKMEKNRAKEPAPPAVVAGASNPIAPIVSNSPRATTGWPFPTPGASEEQQQGSEGNATDVVDPIDLALRQAAAEGNAGSSSAVAGTLVAPVAGSNAAGGYKLSDEDRAKLLGAAQAAQAEESGKREVPAPPVNCRVSASNLAALLAMLAEDSDTLDSARGILCEVRIPNALAKTIANKLVGMVVNDQEIQAIMQTELLKLD